MFDFIKVTEIPNENIPLEQYSRILRRYSWATLHCQNKRVLECSCGSGQGSDMINKTALNYIGSDIDENLIKISKNNNPEIKFEIFDACDIPYSDNSFDVVIIFEAIYYLNNFDRFLNEAYRVLSKNGLLLIVTANKDLYDFSKSPFSTNYYSINEINLKLEASSFLDVNCYGDVSVKSVPTRQKFLRPIKYLFSKLNLIPKSMNGKKLLKNFFYGKNHIEMPNKLSYRPNLINDLVRLENNKKNFEYKTIYIKAKK